jgi:hypothetical protein
MNIDKEFIDEGGNVDWEKLKRSLMEISRYKPLTGLTNRGAFESAAETLAGIARNAEDPLLRLKAEQFLTDYGLGPMLVDWSEGPLEDS